MAYDLMDPGQIGMNALAAFERGQGMKKQEQAQNALSAYAVTPDAPGAFETLAKYHPEIAIQERSRREAAQREARMRELTGKAAQGDKGALLEMWGVDPDTAIKLDDRQKEETLKGFKYLGTAALQIAELPPEQHAQAWDGYIDQGIAMGFDGLAQYKGKYSPQALNAVAARADKMKDFLAADDPQLRNVAYGDTVVDTRPVASGGSPRVVIAPNPGNAQTGTPAANIPPPPPGFVMNGGPTQPASGQFPQ